MAGMDTRKAPLSQWHILAPFDSADECQKRLDTYVQGLNLQDSFRGEPKTKALARMPRCIATDDPRLKEK
jgi:hypothetical protein